MTIIESILGDIQNGEPPEKCLAELESVVERLTGPLPDNQIGRASCRERV